MVVAKVLRVSKAYVANDARAPTFTVDWFSNNEEVFRKKVGPMLQSTKTNKRQEIRALEIGSYEGRSALWMLQHLGVHHVTCIDDFRDVDPLTIKAGARSAKDVRATFMKNMETNMDAGRVVLIEAAAETALRSMAQTNKKKTRDKILDMTDTTFDLIYIDASKDSRFVLEHAVLSFPLLSRTGVMVFDDYTSSQEHDGSCPKQGIDAFLEVYSPYIRVRHMGWQVVVQRRARPLASARAAVCHSEYFD
jgi:predicted O-methyltransferase YrrM